MDHIERRDLRGRVQLVGGVLVIIGYIGLGIGLLVIILLLLFVFLEIIVFVVFFLVVLVVAAEEVVVGYFL